MYHQLAILIISCNCLGAPVYNFAITRNKKQTCLQASAFVKKETLAKVFSCEFCEILKKLFFAEHLRWLLQSSQWPSGFSSDIML